MKYAAIFKIGRTCSQAHSIPSFHHAEIHFSVSFLVRLFKQNHSYYFLQLYANHSQPKVLLWLQHLHIHLPHKHLKLSISKTAMTWKCIFPQNSYVETLTPMLIILEAVTFLRWLGNRVKAPWMRSVPLQKRWERVQAPSAMWSYSEKIAVYEKMGPQQTPDMLMPWFWNSQFPPL